MPVFLDPTMPATGQTAPSAPGLMTWISGLADVYRSEARGFSEEKSRTQVISSAPMRRMPTETSPSRISEAGEAAWLSEMSDATLRAAAVRDGFRALFSARGVARDRLFDSLVELGDADAIVAVAFDDYTSKGNADRLDLAARLLSEIGAAAAGALARIVTTAREGQDTFVDLIATSTHLSTSVRTRLMSELAASPVEATRWRVIHAVDFLPPQAQVRVLFKLLRDPNDELRSLARRLFDDRAPATAPATMTSASA